MAPGQAAAQKQECGSFKHSQSMLVITESREDFLKWRKALSSYVVQSVPPDEVYHI